MAGEPKQAAGSPAIMPLCGPSGSGPLIGVVLTVGLVLALLSAQPVPAL